MPRSHRSVERRSFARRISFAAQVALVCGTLPVASPANAGSLGDPISEQSIKLHATALGFCVGQEATIADAVARYPDLERALGGARLAFDAATGFVCERIATSLRETLGDAVYDQVIEDMRTRVADALSVPDRAQAEAFISEIRLRAEWQIPSPIREALLAVRYEDNPLGEILDGHGQRFESAGEDKMRGLEVRMTLPGSFLSEPGDRPHIVRRWTSRYGTGGSMLTLQVWDLRDEGVSDAEAREYATEGWRVELEDDPSAFAPEGAEVLLMKPFRLERLEGVMLRLSFPSEERVGIEMSQRQELWMLPVPSGHFLSLTCAVSDLASRAETLDARMASMSDLCRQVANTIVLPQLY